MTIGSDVTLTQGIFVSAAHSVEIGPGVLIGEYSSIRDANHGTELSRGPIRLQPMMSAPVEIGAETWIGRGCAILAGVHVGHDVVVGANSVVTRSVEDYAIVVGAPARQVRSRLG